MDIDSLWLALALVLVLEGLLPFVSPNRWRNLFAQMMQMTDGQIRFFGLCSIAVGLLGVTLLW